MSDCMAAYMSELSGDSATQNTTLTARPGGSKVRSREESVIQLCLKDKLESALLVSRCFDDHRATSGT